MIVKTMLLCGIIVAGAGTLFLIVAGRRWWRAMNRAEEELREEMGQEGQITGGEVCDGKWPQRAQRTQRKNG